MPVLEATREELTASAMRRANQRVRDWVERRLNDDAVNIAHLYRTSSETLIDRLRRVYEDFLKHEPTFIRARLGGGGYALSHAIDTSVHELATELGQRSAATISEIARAQPSVLRTALGRWFRFGDLSLSTHSVLGELTTSVVGGGTYYDRLFHMTDTLRSSLVGDVRSALLGGEDFDTLRDRVLKDFGVEKLRQPGRSAYGAVKVYKNEARRQWNLLMRKTAQDADALQVWWATLDTSTTPGCAARHATPISIDAPPRHYNCRCQIAVFPVGYDLTADRAMATAWLDREGWTRQEAALEEAEAFDPSKHPRGERGRWGPGGGHAPAGTLIDPQTGKPGILRVKDLTADSARYTALLARLRAPDGGFSYQPVTRGEPTTGYALSIYPERSKVLSTGALSVGVLKSYVMKNRDVLTLPGRHFGAWHDPKTGKVYLDVSMVVDNAARANTLALRHDQIAYFDLAKGSSVDVNRAATSGQQRRPGFARRHGNMRHASEAAATGITYTSLPGADALTDDGLQRMYQQLTTSLEEADFDPPQSESQWWWGRDRLQALYHVTEGSDVLYRYGSVAWRDLPRMAARPRALSFPNVESAQAAGAPDHVLLRTSSAGHEVKTWRGWRPLRPRAGERWIETATGIAVDSSQPTVWDLLTWRLSPDLLTRFPAMQAITFPRARVGQSYLLRVVDRREAVDLARGHLDAATTWPVDDDPGALAARVLDHSVAVFGDPYLVMGFTNDQKHVAVRSIVSLQTGFVLYARDRFAKGLQAPYLRVAVFCPEPDGRVWAIRPRGKHFWTLPGGHIDPGETPQQAAVREMQEESGLFVVLTGRIGTMYRPWSTTLVFEARKIAVHEPSTPDEIDAVAAVHPSALVEDEHAFLFRHGSVLEAGWDPALHPRDAHGRFGAGGGSKGGPGESVEPEQTKKHLDFERIPEHIAELADELGYPARLISYSGSEGPEFEVGGQKFRAAGEAFKDGRVVLHSGAFAYGHDALRGLMAHEVQHQRYNVVLAAFHKERDAIRTEGWTATDVAGFLKPEEAARYPVTAALEPYFEGEHGGGKVFAKDDGVTPYSTAYWTAWNRGDRLPEGYHTAIHETLAEMERERATTGILPGSKFYRNFYKAVSKLYHKQPGFKREAQRLPERAEVLGVDGYLMYLDREFQPTSASHADFVKVLCTDGRIIFGVPDPIVREAGAVMWDPEKHPRGYRGRFGRGQVPPNVVAAVDETPGKTGFRVQRAPREFTGAPVATRRTMSKQATGALGELITSEYLRSRGIADAKILAPAGRNNYPIDIISKSAGMAIETKAGQISNVRGAQQWRLTLGQARGEKAEIISGLAAEQKRAYNVAESGEIMERKGQALAEISGALGGRKLRVRTITTIINPDKGTADIFVFRGFHKRIDWRSPEAQAAYKTTVKFRGKFRFGKEQPRTFAWEAEARRYTLHDFTALPLTPSQRTRWQQALDAGVPIQLVMITLKDMDAVMGENLAAMKKGFGV